jgi:serine/threonine-protein kinase
LLTRSVGPLASVLVRRAARECTELPALRTRLAEQIGDAAARQAFLAGTAADPLATRTPATPVTQSGTQILAPAAPLDPTLIDKATQLLALRIGPIAKVVARKAAQTSGRDAFFAALAEAVDDAGARSKLLAELSRLR